MITAKQYVRYERQIELCGIGKEGQRKLLDSKVLLIGAGGLGCPASLYLAAAGIGGITVIDDDRIDISNIQRQILYETSHVGPIRDTSEKKVVALKSRLEKMNPDCVIRAIDARFTEENADNLINQHDIIVDGSDNFKTRYLLNKYCYERKKTLVSGAIAHFEGQIYVFKGHQDKSPCYKCLYPSEPTSSQIPSCTESAILGPVAGVVGTMMAVEVLKELLNLDKSLSGSMLMYDSLNSTVKKIQFSKNNSCQVCGVANESYISA